VQVQAYLDFDGRCDEALEFYRTAVGAEVTAVHRFKDAPPGMAHPGIENKVMHASFQVGGSTVLASDGHCQGQKSFQGFSLSLTVENDGKAEKLFGALSDGGQVTMPLSKTFFSSSFGMLTDRFGVSWMVYVAP
jgi:PhnB protein